jgi:hypothetical protein
LKWKLNSPNANYNISMGKEKEAEHKNEAIDII